MTTHTFEGTWKYDGFQRPVHTSWREGKIVVSKENDSKWRIQAFLAVKPNSSVSTFEVTRRIINNVECKRYFVMTLKDGGIFKLRGPTQAELDRLKYLLYSIMRTGKSASQSENSFLLRNRTSPGLTDNKVLNMSKVDSTSPEGFTGLKSSRVEKSCSESVAGLRDPDKENIERTSTPEKKTDSPFKQPTPSSKMFLTNSQQKCRHTLENVSTKNFYGSKPRSAPVFGASPISSGVRRKPGLLDAYPEHKRPRLSNSPIKYSWQNRSPSVFSPNQKRTDLQGFSNLGNTCYMNAILQSLFSLESFSSDLQFLTRSVLKKLATEDRISYLFFAMMKLFTARQRSATSEQCRQYLSHIKKTISSSAKRFSGHEQHDAHEFMSQVLDQMKEEFNKVANDCSPNADHSVDSNDQSPPPPPIEAKNPTSLNFEFAVLHTIKCSGCDEIVNKEETFHDISLDMPKSRDNSIKHSIQDAFDRFWAKEKIEYTCQKCHGKLAVVSHTLTRLPRVLIVHLKRYTFTVSQTKVGRNIAIPRYLTLGAHSDQNTWPAAGPEKLFGLESRSRKKSCDVELTDDRNMTEKRNKIVEDGDPLCRNNDKGECDTNDTKEKHVPTEEEQMEWALAESLQETQRDVFEDKENVTPPKKETCTKETETDADCQTEVRRESDKEEDDLKVALEKSLREHQARTSDEEDEELRRAKELSLQDWQQTNGFVELEENEQDVIQEEELDEEAYKKQAEELRKNSEDGNLPYSYRLVSVVSHLGASSSLGHYVTDIYDVRKKTWLSCDDSEVSPTTEDKVRTNRERTGYIFFYQSKELAEELVEIFDSRDKTQNTRTKSPLDRPERSVSR